MVVDISPTVRELAEDGEDALASELEAHRRAELDRKYPKPTLADITSLRQHLQDKFRDFHGVDGAVSASTISSDYDTGMDSIRTVRAVRYGRDEMPEKLRQRLQYGYRVRSMLTHNEIEMVVALLGRNPLMFSVPASGSSQDAKTRADKNTDWLQHIPDALERNQKRSVIAPLDDSNAEDSVMVGEIYLTGAWDDLDEEPRDGEDEDGFLERITAERRKAGLPFGLRPIDPLAAYWKDDSGEGADEQAMIIERKPYRYVFDEARKRMTAEQWTRASMPEPRADGAPQDVSWGTVAEVETLRYYDSRWYVFTVGNQVVECEEHGMPFMPVVVEVGNRTSSSTYPDQFHGVTWGRTSLERSTNDTLTSGLDTILSYQRPMPIFQADAAPGVQDINGGGAPKVLEVRPGLGLPPGYKIADAFAGFRDQGQAMSLADALGTLFKAGGVSGVAGGTSPGADAAGYTVNLLMSASLAKYKGLVSAKQRFWQRVGDNLRLLVKYTIADTVELSAPMSDGKGAQWISLAPDDVDEMPCMVSEDLLDDTNRIAIAQWLIGGMDKGLVTEERVMAEGFGSTDVAADRAEILRDEARRQLRPVLVQAALAEVTDEDQAPAPVLVGANGEPISSDMLQQSGGLPADLQPPTVGAAAMESQGGGMNYRTAITGQQPPGMGGSPMAGRGPVNG